MRCAVAALVLSLLGCDSVFGLDGRIVPDAPPPIDAAVVDGPPDAPLCSLPGHDEDFDSVRDECDNCPTIQNQNQLNSDSDGLGDACDPNLGLGGDRITKLALFHNSEDGFVKSPGGVTFGVDDVVLSPTGKVTIAVAAITRIDAEFTLLATGVNSRFMIAVVGPTATHGCRAQASMCNLNGTATTCILATNGGNANPVDWAIPGTAVTRLRLQISATCQAFSGPAANLLAQTSGAPVTDGTLELSVGSQSTVTVTSVVVYGAL